MTDSNTIHDAVQANYGAIAEGEKQDSCCNPTTLYDVNLLDGLDVNVTGLSLGCGDPVTIAALKPGETVLDLGSGGGIDCFMAARQVGDTGYVIGVDMTPSMLEKANASKARMGITNVDFREGHIENLPVDDNTVDVIMSNCVINLSPSKPDVFSEALRVLKPGGRLSISDIVTEGEFTDELRADMEKWTECVTGAIDADEYIDMIRAAGFTDIQVVDKVDAKDIVPHQEGMPRLFSARITAYKPQPTE